MIDPKKNPSHERMGRSILPPQIEDEDHRVGWGLPADPTKPGRYMIELNLMYRGGLDQAAARFKELYRETVGDHSREPSPVSKGYFAAELTVDEVRNLARVNEFEGTNRREPDLRPVYRIWPDFPVKPLIDRSVVTVKSDAAVRAFDASGKGIVWAVIDSGIDQKHPHFAKYKTLTDNSVSDLHRDFTPGGSEPLTDNYGHGTHVAGIIAGGLDDRVPFLCYEHVYQISPDASRLSQTVDARKLPEGTVIRGVAPMARLVSLKVLNDDGAGHTSDVMRALQYIRDGLNGDPKFLRVHGVNLSLGYEFDAEMFACGQSPLCVEVDRLVKSGVVVVVAAGNTGYGRLPAQERFTKVGISNSINDPGNAALAITVGATHRDSPHLYGVSYFSSKGPTGDGRLKPDLVAPGERITSCATGTMRGGVPADVPADAAVYIDDTGTSMAAPHVSGAIAAFLSIRQEFVQRPDEVKRIFLESAISLGRERYFEGHGLVDLMRAIQSV